MRQTTLVMALALLCTCWSGGAMAQAISADGVIQSTSGGVRFPDGSTQVTAAAPGSVADTGQTQCYDATGTLRPCAGTGEDGESAAGVSWPTPRFTDNGDGTVTDNLTWLVWLKDANCPGGTKSWQEALDWIKNPLNSAGTACSGYTPGTFADWRLPNVRELLSLIAYGQASPALPIGHPFMNVSSENYRTSTTFADGTGWAWWVYLGDGHATAANKTIAGYVWPVRGGH